MCCLRFCENEYYDIVEDADVVTLMAITNVGTFHSTVKVEKASDLRVARDAFKTYCLQAMALGQPPKEVQLG